MEHFNMDIAFWLELYIDLRENKKYQLADEIRDMLKIKGYDISVNKDSYTIENKKEGWKTNV